MRRGVPIAIIVIGALAFALGGSRLIADLADRHAHETQAHLERAVAHGLARHRALQLELAQTAVALGRSELTVKLGLVADNALLLTTLSSELEKAVPGPPGDPALARLRAARADTMPAVGTFAADYAGRLSRLGRGEDLALLEAEGRSLLVACIAADRWQPAGTSGVGARECAHAAALEALGKFATAERKVPGLGPDVLMVVDDRGIGLADIDRPTWSAVSGVTHTLPVLAEALTTRAVVRDVGFLPDRNGLYLMVAVPLLEGESLRGAGLVAVALGGQRLEADADAVGADLSWGLVGWLGVAASTLPPEGASAIDGPRFLTSSSAVPGNASATPTLIASVVKEVVFRPFDEATRNLWLFAGGAALLLSLALVLMTPSKRV